MSPKSLSVICKLRILNKRRTQYFNVIKNITVETSGFSFSVAFG